MKAQGIITGLALAALSAPAPAQTNFLEFLFGAQPQARVAYPVPQAYQQGYPQSFPQSYPRAPVYRDRAAIARDEAQRKAREKARQAAAEEASRRERERNAEFLKALGELQRQKPGSIEVFLNDPTLRKGDIVATRKGLSVYQGTRSEPRPADFIAIAAVRNLPNRNMLLALQASSFASLAVASSVPPAEPRQLTIRPRRIGEPAEAAVSGAAVRVIPVQASLTR